MADGTRTHRVSITLAEGKTIEGWTDYELSCSMVEPADTFTLSRAFTLEAWKLCKPDTRVRISIDGVVQIDGFIDERERDVAAGTIKISGRDKIGRLVQTSIPTVSGFDGLMLDAAVKKLAAPWFTEISFSDTRNRRVRRGKGGKAPAGSEPAIFNVSGKLDEEHAGKVDPGEMCWTMIEQLCSSVSLLCWSAGDGRELIIGKPNYQQAVQYLIRHSRTGPQTIKGMVLTESVQDRYALIEQHGTGTGDDEDYGDNVTSYLGKSLDGPNADGTGRDFQHPKRLALSQSALEDNREAGRAAQREMNRRSFKRSQLVVQVALHGQRYSSPLYTLFAPNTLARVVDEELQTDTTWLIYAVKFKGAREAGETTELRLIPRGTVFTA